MVRLNFSISDALDKELNDAAERYYEGNRSEVLRKALALFKTARRAHETGKCIGETSDPNKLDTHWVGMF